MATKPLSVIKVLKNFVRNMLKPSSINYEQSPTSAQLAIKRELEDGVTHTGQKFETGDYRLQRFMHTPKQINPNIAINLIAAVPPKACEERVVFCNGGGDLGHPKVYINLDKPGNHTCGYCGLRFYKEDHAH